MKTGLKRLTISGLLLVGCVITINSEPSPDLMNSITAMRLEAQKALPVRPSKSESWSRTRNITAGQSTVSVPDAPRIKAKEIQVAPLKEPKVESK